MRLIKIGWWWINPPALSKQPSSRSCHNPCSPINSFTNSCQASSPPMPIPAVPRRTGCRSQGYQEPFSEALNGMSPSQSGYHRNSRSQSLPTGFTQILPGHVQAGWPGIGTVPAAWQPVWVFHDNGAALQGAPEPGRQAGIPWMSASRSATTVTMDAYPPTTPRCTWPFSGSSGARIRNGLVNATVPRGWCLLFHLSIACFNSMTARENRIAGKEAGNNWKKDVWTR